MDLGAFQGAFPQAYWLQVKEKQRRNAVKDAEIALQAFLKHTLGEGIHIVAGIGDDMLWLITAYRPGPDQWNDDLKTRRAKP